MVLILPGSSWMELAQGHRSTDQLSFVFFAPVTKGEKKEKEGRKRTLDPPRKEKKERTRPKKSEQRTYDVPTVDMFRSPKRATALWSVLEGKKSRTSFFQSRYIALLSCCKQP